MSYRKPERWPELLKRLSGTKHFDIGTLTWCAGISKQCRSDTPKLKFLLRSPQLWRVPWIVVFQSIKGLVRLVEKGAVDVVLEAPSMFTAYAWLVCIQAPFYSLGGTVPKLRWSHASLLWVKASWIEIFSAASSLFLSFDASVRFPV